MKTTELMKRQITQAANRNGMKNVHIGTKYITAVWNSFPCKWSIENFLSALTNASKEG